MTPQCRSKTMAPRCGTTHTHGTRWVHQGSGPIGVDAPVWSPLICSLSPDRFPTCCTWSLQWALASPTLMTRTMWPMTRRWAYRRSCILISYFYSWVVWSKYNISVFFSWMAILNIYQYFFAIQFWITYKLLKQNLKKKSQWKTHIRYIFFVSTISKCKKDKVSAWVKKKILLKNLIQISLSSVTTIHVTFNLKNTAIPENGD